MPTPASGTRTLLGLKIDRQIPGQQLGCPEPVVAACSPAGDPPTTAIGDAGNVTGGSVLYYMAGIYAGRGEAAAGPPSITLAPSSKIVIVTPGTVPEDGGAVCLGRRFYRKIDSGPALEIKTIWDNTTITPFNDNVKPGAEGTRTPRVGTTGMSAEQTGANFGFQFIRVDNATDFNRDDTYFKSTEQSGRLGEPRGIPGDTKYTHAFNFDLRIGTLVPLLASMTGKASATQSAAEPVITYGFSLSDHSADSVSLSAQFYRGGDFRPQLFLGMKCSEIDFELSGTKQAAGKAKLMGQHDTESGFGKALAANTGGFASAPVVRGVRSDALGYVNSAYVKIVATPTDDGHIGSFAIQAALDTPGNLTPTFGSVVTTTIRAETGHNDLTGGGTYTGSAPAVFEVEIDSIGTSDTYKWRKNGGAYTIGVTATTGAVVLSDGVTVAFTSATGHAVGDAWTVGVMISTVYYDPTSKRQCHPAAIGNATPTAQQSAWIELWESTTGLALGFDEGENRKPFEVYFPGDVTVLLAGDIFEIPALQPIPDVYTPANPTGPSDDGSYTGQRPRFTFTSRMTPAHVTLTRGPSAGGLTVLDAQTGTLKIARPVDEVRGLGPEAANPIDVDVFGKFTIGLDIDRRYITREFERIGKSDARLYAVVQLQANRIVVDPVAGTLSALREQAIFTFAQARVDKTTAVLSGDKVVPEKITITPEQPDDDTLDVVSLSCRTAHSWDFSRL
jgi:hypothetical protein